MVSGEFFSKLIEYPYAFSLLIIPYTIFGIHGLTVTLSECYSTETEFNMINDIPLSDFIPFAFLFGLGATILAVTDPAAVVIRKYYKNTLLTDDDIRKNYDSKEHHKKYETKKGHNTIPDTTLKKLRVDYVHHAIKDKTLKVEADKLIGLVYLVILIITVTIFFIDDTRYCFLLTQLQVNELAPNLSSYLLNYSLIILLAIISSIAVITRFIVEFINFKRKIRTVAIYLMAVAEQKDQQSSTDKMEKFIEDGNWEFAEQWSHDYVNTFEKFPYGEKYKKNLSSTGNI